VTVWPATVTDPVRACAAVLAATVSVTLRVPVPLVLDRVIQGVPEDAVHAHCDVVVTVTLGLPPPLATDALVGDTLKVQESAAAWVTVTALPAIVTVVVREAVLGLEATVNVTDPLPLLPAGDAVTHAALDVAVHAHPA
jgi:hypothetical protein